MIRKLLEKFRRRAKSEASQLIQASRLEPRIMYSAAPGAELLVDAAVSEGMAEDPNAAVSLVEQLDQIGTIDEENSSNESRNPDQQLEQLLLAFDDPSQTTELVFIDKSVTGYEELVSDILAQSEPGVELILIDAEEDGVDKITNTLSRFSNLEAIHIVSHGSDGSVQLGNTFLSSSSLEGYAGEVASWNNALSEHADVLFYGCELAQSESGRDFLADLSALCDCDFAASDDLTGSSQLGGDWELEFNLGAINTDIVFSESIADWDYVLGTLEIATTKDTYLSVEGSEDDENFGASTTLTVDTSGDDLGEKRSLLYFDLSAIPNGATINSVSLSMVAVSNSGAFNVNVYEVTEFWEEGTEDGGSDTANWTERTDSQSWSTAGGTVDTTVIATSNTAALGEHTWDVTSLVQDWVSGTKSNHGLMLASPDAGHEDVVFASSDLGYSAPKLVIDYTLPMDLEVSASSSGGLSINEDGGNDLYLIADDGASLLGGLTEFTFETQFSSTQLPSSSFDILSYATPADSNDVRFIIDNIGGGNYELRLYVNGSTVNATGFNANQLFDGERHSVAASWSSTAGDYVFYVDGVAIDSGTGHQVGYTLNGGGALVVGRDQDSVGGGFTDYEYFSGKLYDVRIFDTVRTGPEVLASHDQDLPFDEPNLIANWRFDSIHRDETTGEQTVTDIVSGNNLLLGRASGSGITESEVSQSLEINENSANGAVVGDVMGLDAERAALIASLLSSDPSLVYSAETGKFYKAVSTGTTWSAASAAALSTNLNGVGGQLATIRSATENDVAFQIANGTGTELWLGGSDSVVEGEWRWLEDGAIAEQFWQGADTGTNVGGAYVNWAPGEPNNQVTGEHHLLIRPTGLWNDLDGTESKGYLIEWDADEVLDNAGPVDEQPLTYSIATQSVAGAFAIDSDSGEITVLDGTLLDFESASTHTVRIRVADVDGNLHEEDVTIKVLDQNDAPTSGNNTVTIDEDTTYTFSSSDFSFSDQDGDSLASVKIVSLETVGALQLNGSDVSLNQIISRADIDAGLLTFSPALDTDGSSYDSFDFSVNDGMDDSSVNYTMTIDVNGVNDAPVLTGANALTSINEDDVTNGGSLVTSLLAGHVTDPDTSSVSGIAVVAVDDTNGVWQYSVNGGSSWSAFGSVDPSNARLLAADANTLVRFVPNSNWNGTVSNGVTFHAWDQTAGVAGGTFDLTSLNTIRDEFNSVGYDNTDGTNNWSSDWTEFNDDSSASSGVVRVESGSLYLDNSGGGGFPGIVRGLDLSGATSATLTYDFGGYAESGTDGFAVQVSDNGGGSWTSLDNVVYVDSPGETISGSRSFDLGSFVGLTNDVMIRFEITAGFAGPGQHVTFDNIQVEYNSGPSTGGSTAFSTATESSGITVDAVNDAPTAAGNTVSTNEDTAYTFVASDFNFGDIDGGSLASIEITALESVGSLQLNGTDVVLNQVVSRADIDAGLLSFDPLPDAHGTGHDSFDFTVNDGMTDSVSSYTMSVDVTPVNDAPTAASNTVTTNEDTDYTFTTSDFGFGDVDGDSLASIEITSLESIGSLQLNGVDVALNQVISRADIDAGLLTFTPVGDANGIGYDNFDFTVNDGTTDSVSSYTISVDVTPVNDAPTAASNTVTTNEDTDYTFTASDFGFGDVDGDSLASIQIASLESVGSLQLNGVDVALNQVVSRADIDAGLLTFTPVGDANGTGYDNFDFTVNDGTTDSVSSYTMTVDVTAINDAPTAASNSVTTNEDTDYTLTTSDFGFGDVDGDSLASIQITSLESVGSLQLNGVDVALNQVVSRADIDAGLLTYTPVGDANGTGYDSFDFTVNDGTTDSVSSYTMTVDVTAVNDAPTAASNTVSTNEDTDYTFTASDFGFGDVDGDSLASIQITSLESVGSLQLNGVDVTLNQVISRGDIDAGLLTFTPVGDANGAAYDSFDFTVNDGTTDSVSNYTMSVDVAAVNDAPTAASNTVATNEDTPITFSTSDFNFSDIDGDAFVSIEITSLEAFGSLQLNGIDVALNQVISRSDIDAGLLAFVPGPDDNGMGYDSFGFTVNDGTTDSVSSYTITIDVVATPDLPTTADTTLTINEDQNYPLQLSDFPYSDPDGDLIQQIQITNTPTNGVLALNSVAVSAGDIISAGDISAGRLTYTPAADANGIAMDGFGFRVGDGSGFSIASSTVSLLDATFDSNAEGFVYSDDVFGTSAPGNALGNYVGSGGFDGGGLMVRVGGRGGVASSGGWSQTINVAEDGFASISLRFNLNVDNRLDVGEYGEAVFEIDGVRYGGALNDSLAHYEGGGTSGWQVATFEVELGAGSHTLTFGAYTNSTNANRERVFAYFDEISVDHQVFNRVEFDVNPVNDAAQISGIESSNLSYLENTGPVGVTNGILLGDIDDSLLESAVIQITGNYNSAEDVLSFANTANINGSWDSSTGTLTLTGSDTVANYQAALRSVTFENLSDNPSTLDRTVSFTVNDGDVDSATESRIVEIQAVNDESVVANIESVALNYFENDGPVAISSLITVADIDDTQIESARIQISGDYQPGEDELAFTNTPNISGSWDALSGMLTLTGADSIANYQTALRSVTYENLSDNPSNAIRTVRFTVNDGDVDSNSQTRNVQVTPVNDAPIVNSSDSGNLTYVENSTVNVFPTTGISDVDDVNLEAATVRISANFVSSEDVLSFVDTPRISGTYDSTSGVLTLVGTDSVANYQAAIQSIQYTNTSDNPSTLSRTVEVTVNDGALDSTVRARTIDIQAVNDAPNTIIDGPMTQDESSSFTVLPMSNDFDPEGDAFQLTAINGTNVVAGGAAVSVTGGTIALESDGLTLTFTPDRNFFGNADFTYTVADVHGLSSDGLVQLDIVDTTPPDDLVSVRIDEDVNDDGFINLAEHQGNLDYLVALPLSARVGEILNVNGNLHVLTASDVSNGQVSGSLAPPAHNTNFLLSAFLLDPAGNASGVSSDVAVVDLVAPTTSAPLNLISASDTGVSNSDNYTGEMAPSFRLPAGTGTPGDVVTIFSNGTPVSAGFVDSDGSALVTVSVSDFTVQKFTYTFTDAAGNESAQSIGLFVEFFDDALPYQPPSNPNILGVEKITIEDPDPLFNLFDLRAGEDPEDEKEKIPFFQDFSQNSSLELGLDSYTRSIGTDEIESIDFGIRTAFYYEKEFDGQKLIEFSGDLNYRVATTRLDNLNAYDYQMENFLNRLTELANENREDYSEISLLAGSASAGAGMVIAGYALWMVRAAFIASWFATSIPAFTGFDPLALLSGSGRDKETLAQIAKGKSDK